MEEEIKNDVRFNYINKKYGLDINNIEIINLDNDYVIINHFKNSEIYILFDKNYNVSYL